MTKNQQSYRAGWRFGFCNARRAALGFERFTHIAPTWEKQFRAGFADGRSDAGGSAAMRTSDGERECGRFDGWE